MRRKKREKPIHPAFESDEALRQYVAREFHRAEMRELQERVFELQAQILEVRGEKPLGGG